MITASARLCDEKECSLHNQLLGTQAFFSNTHVKRFLKCILSLTNQPQKMRPEEALVGNCRQCVQLGHRVCYFAHSETSYTCYTCPPKRERGAAYHVLKIGHVASVGDLAESIE